MWREHVAGQGGALAVQCWVRCGEVTNARFWPGFRTGAPSVVDFGNTDGLVWMRSLTLLLAWLVPRSFRLGPVDGTAPSGRHGAGPQPNSGCCCQPGDCSLTLAFVERLQQNLVR